jgi:hypothetical protein
MLMRELPKDQHTVGKAVMYLDQEETNKLKGKGKKKKKSSMRAYLSGIQLIQITQQNKSMSL